MQIFRTIYNKLLIVTGSVLRTSIKTFHLLSKNSTSLTVSSCNLVLLTFFNKTLLILHISIFLMPGFPFAYILSSTLISMFCVIFVLHCHTMLTTGLVNVQIRKFHYLCLTRQIRRHNGHLCLLDIFCVSYSYKGFFEISQLHYSALSIH